MKMKITHDFRFGDYSILPELLGTGGQAEVSQYPDFIARISSLVRFLISWIQSTASTGSSMFSRFCRYTKAPRSTPE